MPAKREITYSIIFPGLGHFAQNRYWRSVVFVVLAAACLECLLVTLFVFSADWKIALAAGLFYLAIWARALMETAVHARMRPAVAGRKKEIYRKGMLAYLRNDLAEAEQIFSEILLADNSDADAHHALGAVMMASNKKDAAAKHLRRVLDTVDDNSGKWEWESRQLLKKDNARDKVLAG